MFWRRHTFLFLLAVLDQLSNPVYADIYTSIASVKKMLRNERNLLNELKNNFPDDFTKQGDFQMFYQRKRQEIDSRNLTEKLQQLDHPNEVYLVIKGFARSYGLLSKLLAGQRQPWGNFRHLSSVAGSQDIDGCLMALLRLQDVYSLKTRDMIAGKYSGFSGPQLSVEDVFLLGDAAFRYGRYVQSVDWLETATTGLYSPPVIKEIPGMHNVSRAHMFGLLGRACLRTGDTSRAKNIYRTWKPQDPDEDELKTLGKELDKNLPQTKDATNRPLWNNFRICDIHDSKSKASHRPILQCRYRGLVPYFRYKEELVSESPYISIIYDVITDKESRAVKRLSSAQMSRGEVVTDSGIQSSYTRVCHVAFLADNTSSTVVTLSRRIGYITGLDTTVSPQGFLSPTQSSSEPLQVVNYGVGGYFGIHRDPFEYRNRITDRVLTHSGNRIASFLIYLSHVHLGGYTSFPDLDLIMHPVKNSALFWYNYSPSGHQEELTWHQGCPVVIGDKWSRFVDWSKDYGKGYVLTLACDHWQYLLS